MPAKNTQLPGYKELINKHNKDWELLMFSADRLSATYAYIPVRGITCTVYYDSQRSKALRCQLQSSYKLVTFSTGMLSFPHPNFELFLNQIIFCYTATGCCP